MDQPVIDNSGKRDRNITLIISYMLVTAMLVCVTISIIQFAQRIQPNWNGLFLIGLAIPITLEALLTLRLTAHFSAYSKEMLIFHLTEWVVLLIALKLYTVFSSGATDLFRLLSAWNADFIGNFFTMEYILTVAFLLFIWVLSKQFGEYLEDLEEKPDVLDLERQGMARSDRERTRKGLIGFIFGLGCLLFFIAAILHLDVRGLPSPPAPARVWNLILYFIFGFALLGLARYSVLKNRWYLEKIPVSHHLAVHWIAYSLAAFLAIGLITLLLPTTYSIGFLKMLQTVIGVILAILSILGTLLFAPFILFFQWLFTLLGFSSLIRPVPRPVFPTPPPVQPITASPFLEILRSVLFWLIFFVVVGYSIYTYAKQRRGMMATLQKSSLIPWFQGILHWILNLIRNMNRQVSKTILASIARIHVKPSTTIHDLSSGRRQNIWSTPRETVLHTYLELLRQTKENGLPRKPVQTPNEFASILDHAFHEVSPEIHSITNAFVEARYSQHDVSAQKASLVSAWWAAIHRILTHREE